VPTRTSGRCRRWLTAFKLRIVCRSGRPRTSKLPEREPDEWNKVGELVIDDDYGLTGRRMAETDPVTKDLDDLFKQARSAKRLLEPGWFLDLAFFQGQQWVSWAGDRFA